MRVYRSDAGWQERGKGYSRRCSDRLDEHAKLSLGMVASLQTPLPFHLAKSLYLTSWLEEWLLSSCWRRIWRCRRLL